MSGKTKRTRKAGPKRSAPTLVLIPENWTDDQAIAVYDFCTALQELVWRRYHEALIDPMLQKQLEAKAALRIDNRTYPLPFDDEPSF